METPNLLKTWAFTLVQAFDYKKILCPFEDVHLCTRGETVNPGLITGAAIANSRIRTQTLDLFFLKVLWFYFGLEELWGKPTQVKLINIHR